MEQLPNENTEKTTSLSVEGQTISLRAFSAGLAERGIDLDKWWKERNARVLEGDAADTTTTTQASDQPVGE